MSHYILLPLKQRKFYKHMNKGKNEGYSIFLCSGVLLPRKQYKEAENNEAKAPKVPLRLILLSSTLAQRPEQN